MGAYMLAIRIAFSFIVLLETRRANFATPFLKHLFLWVKGQLHVILSTFSGKVGGILVGINMETTSIQRMETRDFCVKLFVKTKSDEFEWILVGVYGAAHGALKPDFIADMVRTSESKNLPMLVGGDFNIIRYFNARRPFMFNTIIETLDLREIIMPGRQFTWASRREIPTYEKLDRVLTNVK
jgi:hypothetical protein